MKALKLVLASALALFALTAVSCKKDDPTKKQDNPHHEQGGPDDGGEDKPDVSTGFTFEADFADGNTLWDAESQIGVFPADGIATLFTTTAADVAADGKKATFKSADKIEGEKYYAVYPYGGKDLLIDNVLTTIVPFEYACDSIPQHRLSVAIAADKKLSFKNVLGFLKIQVADADYTEIVIRSNDSKAYMAGKVKVTISDDGDPEVEVEDGVPFVTLVPAAGKSTIDPGIYSIPVIACAMNQGLSVRAKVQGFMYVSDTGATITRRAEETDLGSIVRNEDNKYTEYVINDDASGFQGCYREFGTKSIETAPHNIFLLGDNDLNTYWNMPKDGLNGGKGDAWEIDGTQTIRGSYLRLEFHAASGKTPKADGIFFEYSIAHDPNNIELTEVYDWAPWTLKVRDYKVCLVDGEYKYGTIQTLTVEDDALPWTAEYNNRYVSNEIKSPNPDYPHQDRLILCCTRTRWNDNKELQPKEAIEGVTFKDLNQELPESRWAMAELHVWMKKVAQ